MGLSPWLASVVLVWDASGCICCENQDEWRRFDGICDDFCAIEDDSS